MSRNITEVLRRGILSTLANWPVILTRFAETLVSVAVVIVAIIGLVVPPIVSAGLNRWTLPEGKSPADVVAQILVEHAALFTYFFFFTLLIGVVLVAIHAYVTAGVTRVFVDGERAAPDAAIIKREQFAAFTMERFLAGAGDFWVRLFWIYNGTWGLFGLILLIPVLIFAVLTVMAAVSENAPAAVVLGCTGAFLVFIVAMLLAIVTGMWTQKAVVVCVTRNASAREALRSGWRETKSDFLRHFVVYFLVSAASAGASAFVSSALAPFSMLGMHGDNPWALVSSPVQIAVWTLQAAIGTAVGSWILAAFAAMTGER